MSQYRKSRETIARRENMSPEQVAEDKRRLGRERSRKYRKRHPEHARLGFLASGGIDNPARIRSRKTSSKVHRVKEILLRRHVGEEKYAELLEEARRIVEENKNEIPSDFKKTRFQRADLARDGVPGPSYGAGAAKG